MSCSKPMSGYGTGKPLGQKNGLKGGQTGGKLLLNGGFGGQPTVTFSDIDQDKWDRAFPNSFKPSWEKNE